MRLSRSGLAIFLFGLSVIASAEIPNSAEVANAIQLKVEKYQLPNGLTVLLHEDHSAPFFSFNQWFKVGSRNEKPGLTGLAHFFEHLMFKGTVKYPGKVLDRIIQGNGGVGNAFTTRDYTGYYVNLPAGKLELAIDIDSDRMRNLLFDIKEINSEREVVKEERRFRVDNNVNGLLDEKLWRTVFKVHPYHWPVIGSMVDLNRATVDDMKEFYRVYYAPNNAIVVITGDFDTAEAKKLIQKYYGPIASQPVPKLALAPDPDQASERQVKVLKEVQNPTVALAYRSVPSGHPDQYALDIASSVLGDGPSSRLYKKLVYKQQVAMGVSVGNYTPADQGMFRVNISLKPGQNSEAVLRTVYAELYELRTKPLTDAELEKAKNAVMKGYVESLKTIHGKAHALAINEIYFNDYREMFKDLSRYIGVTKEQVKAVADKYFLPTRRAIVRVEPGKPVAQASEADNEGDRQ